jgi:hypothetical protein
MARERDDVVAPWDLAATVARRPDPEVVAVVDEVDSWCLADVVIREPCLDPPRPVPAPAVVER